MGFQLQQEFQIEHCFETTNLQQTYFTIVILDKQKNYSALHDYKTKTNLKMSFKLNLKLFFMLNEKGESNIIIFFLINM